MTDGIVDANTEADVPAAMANYLAKSKWVHAAERTQTWHLPDPANVGPWGDRINAYFTSWEGNLTVSADSRPIRSPSSLD